MQDKHSTDYLSELSVRPLMRVRGPLNGQVRGSGCNLTLQVRKQGGDSAAQYERIVRFPTVFTPAYKPIYRELKDSGYFMPLLRPLQTSMHTLLALQKLETLWHIPAPQREAQYRSQYHDYAMSQTADRKILDTANVLWHRTFNAVGRYAHHLHGDATLENAMLLPTEDEAVWIDPDTRSVALSTHDAELDCGKVLQSAYGYGERMPDGSVEVIKTFLRERRVNRDLCMYYLATHLVRLWKHQSAAHAWALRTAEELL